jgi:hypothetical protein
MVFHKLSTWKLLVSCSMEESQTSWLKKVKMVRKRPLNKLS